jgi:hypothetical protein
MAHARTHARKFHATALAAAVLSLAASLTGQHMAYATYDWPNGAPNTPDRWMDVKSPGDGRIYSVGTTTEVNSDPANNPHFSNAPVQGPTWSNHVTGARQVAVLQVVNTDQQILWQRYFYGFTSPALGGVGGGLSTFARRVSVAPALNPADTRIAIVGDTFDNVLPESVTSPNNNWANTHSSGFLAVYNGNGTLLWSYQFYGRDAGANTTITGVSIRTREGHDEITYCGASTNGYHDGGGGIGAVSTMDPLRPFLAPATNGPDSYSSGDTHQHLARNIPTNQWDGFVGRLSAPHSFTGTPTVTRHFHSIVGGPTDDALLGLAEVDEDVFVTVGCVSRLISNQTGPWAQGSWLPLTNPVTFNMPSQVPAFHFTNNSNYQSFGTVFWFDASNTKQPGTSPLTLTYSTLIGSQDSAITVARDVVVHGDHTWIVGSTTDAQFTSLDVRAANSSFRGPVDSYLLTSPRTPNQPFDHASYVQPGDSDATESHCVGIGAWSEFHDHVSLYGWLDTAEHGKDMYVESWFRDATAPDHSIAPRLKCIRSAVFGGDRDDLPGYTMSMTTGFQPGLNWYPSWELAGGGIDVDPRARVHVVGSTHSSDQDNNLFPGPNPSLWPAADRSAQTGHNSSGTDAVRATLDMLPNTGTIASCRTDLTGNLGPSGWLPSSLYMPPTYTGNGGTTPTCGLHSFGIQIGSTASTVQRQLIDIEGTLLPGSTDVAILLDRPSPSSTIQGSAMLIGIPSILPVLSAGAEMWIPAGQSIGQLYFTTNRSIRVPLGQLPPSGLTYSIQFVSMLPTNHPACPSDHIYVASPALIFSY